MGMEPLLETYLLHAVLFCERYAEASILGRHIRKSTEGRRDLRRAFQKDFKGTVQRELRWVKIGINRTAMKIWIAGKCRLSCPKGHHHKRSINILGGCSTF